MNLLLRSCIAVFALTTLGFAQEAPVPATLKPAERLGEGWWKGRFEQKLALAEKGPYDLVFVGDSITHGWDNGKIPEVMKKHFANATILNLGFSGDRTEHVLWRMARMPWEKIQPKAFMVMIGTNNTGHSNRDSAEDIAAGIGKIVKQLREKAPEAKIMLLAIFPRDDFPNHPQRIKNSTANALIGKLADNKNVFYWDIGAKFMKPDGTTLDRAIMPDQLHPNASGYEIWANAVAETLLKWVGKEPAAETK